MRWSEIINETSSGSTGASNIAIVPGNTKANKGSIGAGFDPNGDWGIYDSAKKTDRKNTKTSENQLLKR